ncbi:MAG: dihydropteroate synthase [Clostridiales bacterium]|jgi:dihydropteroate synthase|nr:dihydropteroate synthase [Clostridiales bacterium]HOA33121.1 dihydropteroate synthase [Clostridiales bacterium]HOJ35779.1 dihydropteroate synthase [Clostridiales bacterium]HOL79949.1 dihydropteroate synthase [Clostridiales bacterium]HPU67296.1 dihydropteroate synthase [Clostridiales bacterium]
MLTAETKKFRFRDKSLTLGERTYIMGILNVTPDSFSDGGLYYQQKEAVNRARQMLAEGADIIDIGGMSTRPFSEPVSEEEEIKRLIPVIKEVRAENPYAIISADTYRINVAEKALRAGADIINDVSGEFKHLLAELIKDFDAGWIIMHSGGVPSGEFPIYEKGVVREVADFFDDMLEKITAFGIDKSRVCLDPGFGFAKGVEENLQLLKNLATFKKEDIALLVGVSRKRFIGAMMEEVDPTQRLEGTLAANFRAVELGADIVRVHDIAEHKRFFKAADFLLRKG